MEICGKPGGMLMLLIAIIRGPAHVEEWGGGRGRGRDGVMGHRIDLWATLNMGGSF